MHGSLNWKIENNAVKYNIQYKKDFSKIEIDQVDNSYIPINAIAADSHNGLNSLDDYINKLGIVLPTVNKFKETVLNRAYYGILRHFSTEIEKENTILIAIGFSFRDEHINDILLNALKINPTLQLIINIYVKNKNNINEKENKEIKRIREKFSTYNNVNYIIDSNITLANFSQNKLSLNNNQNT